MARFTADQADNYGGQGGGGFFGIANDKETKQVRFMYDTADDIEGMSVHKVEVNGKDRYVNCLREYNQPKDDCPFCRENKPVQARLFIPVYNIDDNAIQIWDRGKTMFQKMTSLCSRYAVKNNLVNNIFEVERNGKPKDTKTIYEIYQIDADDTEIADLGEIPEVLGSVVLDKTADDMEYFLETGEFPPADDEPPVRRRESARRAERDDERPAERTVSRAASRRTPATSRRGRNNEDSF